MMIKYKRFIFSKLNEKIINDWQEVINNSSLATIFHTYDWINFLVDEVGAVCEIIIAYNKNKPIGIFPYFVSKGKYFLKKATTGSFETPYGGPIIVDGVDPKIKIHLLRKQFLNFKLFRSTIVAPPFEDKSVFSNSNYNIIKRYTMNIDLNKSLDLLWLDIHKMKKRNVKKSLKNNVVIKETNKDRLFEFHDMLVDTYDRLELEPPKPIDFYSQLMDRLIPLNRMKLLMAYHENKPIASIILLTFNNSLIFWQGASYKKYMNLGANDLLHWHAIEYGVKNKYLNYNLLHYEDKLGNEILPLKKFKEGFGATPVAYYTFTKSRSLTTHIFSNKQTLH